jgi:hypothetical protein
VGTPVAVFRRYPIWTDWGGKLTNGATAVRGSGKRIPLLIVERFQKVILAILEGRVERLKILHFLLAVLGTKKPNVAKAPTNIPIHGYTTYDQSDVFQFQDPVDPRERLRGRKVDPVDIVQIKDKKTNALNL